MILELQVLNFFLTGRRRGVRGSYLYPASHPTSVGCYEIIGMPNVVLPHIVIKHICDNKWVLNFKWIKPFKSSNKNFS